MSAQSTLCHLYLDVEAMLVRANDAYEDAAACHSMGKVGTEGGKITALKEVLKMISAAQASL